MGERLRSNIQEELSVINFYVNKRTFNKFFLQSIGLMMEASNATNNNQHTFINRTNCHWNMSSSMAALPAISDGCSLTYCISQPSGWIIASSTCGGEENPHQCFSISWPPDAISLINKQTHSRSCNRNKSMFALHFVDKQGSWNP